jgi:hypothetical protein
VCWHTKTSLVERYKGHHVSFRRSGEHLILWHMTSPELRRHHEPMLHKFLQMTRRNDKRGPVLLHHGSGRKGRQHLGDLGISPIFLSLSLSSFHPSFFVLGIGKEVRRE